MLKFLFKKSLVIFALIYLTFLFLNTAEIHDAKAINYKKGLSEVVGSSTVDTFNQITTLKIITDYKENLIKEADFSKNKLDTSGKNGFKRDYLFLLFLKDALIFLGKIVIFIYLLKILKRLIFNQKPYFLA